VTVGLKGHLEAERRRHPRLSYIVPVKISSDDVDIVTETINLSCNGVFCQVQKRIEPMTKLKVHLLLPLRKDHKIVTKKVTCMGVVIRAQLAAEQDYETAIFFNDISPRDVRMISDFIEKVQEEKESGKLN
jgi:hypothetical protein